MADDAVRKTYKQSHADRLNPQPTETAPKVLRTADAALGCIARLHQAKCRGRSEHKGPQGTEDRDLPKGSALPAKLAEFGYRPHHLCVTSRIIAGAFETVDVVSISLPGK